MTKAKRIAVATLCILGTPIFIAGTFIVSLFASIPYGITFAHHTYRRLMAP